MRIPGTSFQRNTARAESAARKERRRQVRASAPECDDPPVRRRAVEARHDRNDASSSGSAPGSAGRCGPSRPAAAMPLRSVRPSRSARADPRTRRGRPAAARPAAKIRADISSPRESSASSAPAERSRTKTGARERSASSSNARPAVASSSCRTGPGRDDRQDRRAVPPRQLRRDLLDPPRVLPDRRGGLEQRIGHARQRRNDHSHGPSLLAASATAFRIARASASEAPPNLWTVSSRVIPRRLPPLPLSSRGAQRRLKNSLSPAEDERAAGGVRRAVAPRCHLALQ